MMAQWWHGGRIDMTRPKLATASESYLERNLRKKVLEVSRERYREKHEPEMTV